MIGSRTKLLSSSRQSRLFAPSILVPSRKLRVKLVSLLHPASIPALEGLPC